MYYAISISWAKDKGRIEREVNEKILLDNFLSI